MLVPKLNFRMFLVEMTSQEEKDRIQEIIRHLIAGDESWIESKSIDAKDKGRFWILNYDITGDNEYNRLVRGMVIEKPNPDFNGNLLGLIKSFPLKRFFNKQETGKAAVFDLSNSEMLEKLDGTMVGVFFPNGTPDPHWHTRKMVSSHAPDSEMSITAFHGGEYRLIPLIGSFVKKLPFEKKDTEYTYVFEFIHDATHVVTKYGPDKHGLHLLAARHLGSHLELNEQELDSTASRLGVGRPRRWDAIADEAEIAKLMKEIAAGTPNFEGFVFRDKASGDRVKLKDEEYVKIHHLLDRMTYKNLVQKVLEGEADEVLAYFPTAKPRIDKILERHNSFVKTCTDRILFWKAKGLDRKPLAIKMFGTHTVPPKPEEPSSFVRNMVFRYAPLDADKIEKGIDQELRAMAVKSPKKYLDVIGLSEEEE